MKLNSLNCPNCAAPYDPRSITCRYCRSVIIMSQEKQYSIPESVIEHIESDENNCPGVYVFGTLLGKGETPLRLGVANYYKNAFINVGGKILLTKKSIQFSTHNFIQSKHTVVIPLKEVLYAEYNGSNLGISDTISVHTAEKCYKFVVYGGQTWVALIEKAKGELEAPKKASAPVAPKSEDYTDELLKLKKLLDAGVITEEEFAKKKKILLNI